MRAGLPFYYLPGHDERATNSIFRAVLRRPAATIPDGQPAARLNGAGWLLSVSEMTTTVRAALERVDDFPAPGVETTPGG